MITRGVSYNLFVLQLSFVFYSACKIIYGKQYLIQIGKVDHRFLSEYIIDLCKIYEQFALWQRQVDIGVSNMLWALQTQLTSMFIAAYLVLLAYKPISLFAF